MKAILVIDIPNETNINELNRMMKVGEKVVVACNVLKIKPIPQKLDYASDWEDVETSFRQGWNACLEEIENDIT